MDNTQSPADIDFAAPTAALATGGFNVGSRVATSFGIATYAGQIVARVSEDGAEAETEDGEV